LKEDHITKEEFMLDYFGYLGGRDLGNPKQFFVDNPNEIIKFVNENNAKKLPSYCSVQPRKEHKKILGIEKLFFEFDYGHENEKLSDKKIEEKKVELEQEVKDFVSFLDSQNISPLIVKTRRGYHVYIYFDHVYDVTDSSEEFLRELYVTLIETIISRYFCFRKNGGLKYLDEACVKDVYRMARVPFSIHEKSGEECILVELKNNSFNKSKIRGIAIQRQKGLKEEDFERAIKETKAKLKKRENIFMVKREQQKQNWIIKHGFVGKIRPCFIHTLKSGEMPHQQRLALLIEAWYSGYRTEDDLTLLFTPLHDFKDSITRSQVRWFLKNGKWKTKPYRCSTLIKLGYCIGKKCPYWRKH
jgi:hypothetical protein